MKRKLSLALFLLTTLLTSPVFSDQAIIGKGTTAWFNDYSKSFEETDYVLRYDANDKITWIYFNTGGLTAQICVLFNDDQRKKLSGYLDKFQEWNKKAIKEGVKLEKEIGSFNSWCAWEMGNDWTGGRENNASGDIKTSFFSQNKKVHQFLLEFPSYSFYGNPLGEHPETLYFSSSQALTLSKQLADENIQKAVTKASKSKKVEEDFK